MARRLREAVAPETFRPRPLLRAVVLGADTLWIVTLFALLFMRGATGQAMLSAAFFVALFSACAYFYGRLAYTVSELGLTVRSLKLERTFSFDEILRVDVVPGLLGRTYAVRTRGGSLTFSSLLGGHDRLCSLIVRGAGLSEA
jgi:hypothetical protein